MRGRSVAWLPVGLLALLAGLSLWLNYTVQKARPPAARPLRHDPDYTVERFTARQYGLDGTVRYTLAAKKMIHYADDDTSYLEDVNFAAYEKDEPPVRVVSSFANLTPKADEVFFNGVVVVTREPYRDRQRLTIRTTYLHAVPDAGVANTDRDVIVQEASNVITASGMVLNNKFRIAEFSHAKAQFDRPPVPPR